MGILITQDMLRDTIYILEWMYLGVIEHPLELKYGRYRGS